MGNPDAEAGQNRDEQRRLSLIPKPEEEIALISTLPAQSIWEYAEEFAAQLAVGEMPARMGFGETQDAARNYGKDYLVKRLYHYYFQGHGPEFLTFVYAKCGMGIPTFAKPGLGIKIMAKFSGEKRDELEAQEEVCTHLQSVHDAAVRNIPWRRVQPTNRPRPV